MAQINIEANHTTLTEAMENYVIDKLANIEKFLRDENKVHVELDVETKKRNGPKYRASITILPKPGVYAMHMGEDLYEAVDMTVQKVREQLVKNKDKRISKRREGDTVRKMK